MDDVKANLGPTKRQIIERLKRADAKVADLARALDMTEAGVRQHLDALADHGLVVSRTGIAAGRGRPATVWALTDLAEDLFPDRHDDLTVELITAVRTALGDDGLAKVIDARGDKQRAAYERALPKRGTLRERVAALARIRTEEGYVAEVADPPDAPDGDAVLLIEHHCPICTAASSCPGLCRSVRLGRADAAHHRRRSALHVPDRAGIGAGTVRYARAGSDAAARLRARPPRTRYTRSPTQTNPNESFSSAATMPVLSSSCPK
jgi:predicted ArsR family transcriptional regulator